MCCPPYRTRRFFVWALVAFAAFCADFRDTRAFAGENSEANGPSAKSRPNIVFMLSDDQGWSGTSVRMHPDLATSRSDKLHTPNLERLAARGMRFSEGYAPACVCSPTRIALQTGKNPARLHWTKAAPPEEGHKLVEPRLIKQIDEDERTIGEALHSVGYATAHYGKWHIGGGGPGRHGYDEHDGDTGNEHAFQFQDPNPVDIFGMAERAERFMRRNRDAGKPFFIQLSWNALHAADNALRATLSKYKRQAGVADNETADKRVAVAAITEDLDTGVGRVLAAIDELGLADNTIVIYMSDNGAGGGGVQRGTLRGGKGGVWEGGVRVPFIVAGPGIAANSWCHVRVVGYDWFPTFCEWGGVPASKLPKNLDGGSLAGLLSAEGRGTVIRPAGEIVFHFPHYQSDDGPQSAVYDGDLKLIRFHEDDRLALFDLSRDPGERDDLATSRAADATRLNGRLAERLKQMDAQFATPNPDYDPARPPTPRKKGGGKNKPGKGRPPD
jgi:arylsulfatase A-like enzyme